MIKRGCFLLARSVHSSTYLATEELLVYWGYRGQRRGCFSVSRMRQGCERYWFLFSSGLRSGVSKFGSTVVVVAVVVCLTWVVDVSVRSWRSFCVPAVMLAVTRQVVRDVPAGLIPIIVRGCLHGAETSSAPLKQLGYYDRLGGEWRNSVLY